MTLLPSRASYATGDSVLIDLPSAATPRSLTLWHLSELVRSVEIPAGAESVDLGRLPVGGYGVELDDGQSSAFDVLEDPFDRPRYGFIVKLTGDLDIPAVRDNYRRLHLNVSQFYDWSYRHSVLLPPEDSYVDPLGQIRSLATVNALAEGLSDAGTVPLGYSAVYGIGHEEVADWPDSMLLRPDGTPYLFAEDFLVIVDPAERQWLEHYLAQLEGVVTQTKLQGFHLDQYGWPKFGVRSDGVPVDMTESFVTLISAIRERLPQARFMFNNVNDFPTYATAPTPQDATYIEVWNPHSSLGDLGALATKARSYRPEHPPILSAYLSCYSNGNELAATNAARLTMASIFSHGATHLLAGEDGHVLVHAYYPNSYAVTAETTEVLASYYDFLVRYGDLLLSPEQVDVTEFYAGGVNEEVQFGSATGVAFSTKADAGTVWTRVVRVPGGMLVHLINLTDQTETAWDAEKSDFSRLDGLTLRLVPPFPGAKVSAASPEQPRLVSLGSGEVDRDSDWNITSGAQGWSTISLPTLTDWLMLFIPTAPSA